MAFPMVILLLIVYGYTLLILLFFLEIEQDPGLPAEQIKFQTGVSVVVPFRNEGDHLPGLLADLSRQTYPQELLEFILVDDHSVDDSANMVRALAARKKHIRYLALPPEKTVTWQELTHMIHQRSLHMKNTSEG